MVRAYYAEDGLDYRDDLQPKALAMLVAGDALAKAWIIEVDGATAGYVVVTLSFSIETGGRDGFIDELFIKPERRNQGLGRRVLGLVDQEARRLGLGRIYLEVEHGNPALRLYRRAGYRDHERHLLSKRL
jgi:ribosomal protein S18 acetylase RimI-like enzyme